MEGLGGSIHCSFCGKPREAVRKVIAGGSGAIICDECVDLCNEIILEEIDEEGGPNWWPWQSRPVDLEGRA